MIGNFFAGFRSTSQCEGLHLKLKSINNLMLILHLSIVRQYYKHIFIPRALRYKVLYERNFPFISSSTL
ncbi:hypothetical protein CR513_45972, partial [Mucuna pruriens]